MVRFESVFRVLAGIVSIPVVITAVVFVLGFFLSVSLALTLICFLFWLVFAFPFVLIVGLFQYAMGENAGEAFKMFKDSFFCFCDLNDDLKDVVGDFWDMLCEMFSDLWEIGKSAMRTGKK